jgi:hypothetical protein
MQLLSCRVTLFCGELGKCESDFGGMIKAFSAFAIGVGIGALSGATLPAIAGTVILEGGGATPQAYYEPHFASQGLDSSVFDSDPAFADGERGAGRFSSLPADGETLTVIAGVPELSTWTMMLVWLAGLGLAVRHKANRNRSALDIV